VGMATGTGGKGSMQPPWAAINGKGSMQPPRKVGLPAGGMGAGMVAGTGVPVTWASFDRKVSMLSCSMREHLQRNGGQTFMHSAGE
jgi:hypothetical protein